MPEIFRDGMVAIYQGDARHMTELPDDSVHCCVTSPPYFGLRKYSGEMELDWGGDKNCQHEWGAEQVRSKGHSGDRTTLAGTQTAQLSKAANSSGRFCQKCGSWRGALGLEPSPEAYLSHLVEIFREVKRVLRPDGVFWLNIGDSYVSGKGTCFNPGGGINSLEGHARLKGEGAYPLDRGNKSTLKRSGLKPLDLCLIPERLAILLQQDGWYVRARITWNKQNPMPESVSGWTWSKHKVKVKPSARANPESAHALASEGLRPPQGARDGREFASHDSEWQDCPGCEKCAPNDGMVLQRGSWRPTDSWEHIWMLTKTGNYYCDKEAVAEAIANSTIGRGPVSFGGKAGRERVIGPADPEYRHGSEQWGRTYDYAVSNANGHRNLRSVWTFPTQTCAFPGQHFATFPEKLPEICIKASTPEVGVCARCGAPWARVAEHQIAVSKDCPNTQSAHEARGGHGIPRGTVGKSGSGRVEGWSKTLGWRATCQCGCDDRVGALVLDPFMGTGTVLWVAKKLGRQAIGIDLSETYCKLALERNRQGRLR